MQLDCRTRAVRDEPVHQNTQNEPVVQSGHPGTVVLSHGDWHPNPNPQQPVLRPETGHHPPAVRTQVQVHSPQVGVEWWLHVHQPGQGSELGLGRGHLQGWLEHNHESQSCTWWRVARWTRLLVPWFPQIHVAGRGQQRVGGFSKQRVGQIGWKR